MRQELTELLVRIMTLSCGIEKKHEFFQAVLPEIHKAFAADETQLLLQEKETGFWNEIARFPLELPSEKLPMLYMGMESVECPPLKPVVTGSPQSTDLILPLEQFQAPLIHLCLSWQRSVPPAWIRDESILSMFCEKLGKYLSWEHIMLQIASSKRHLQAIFDHLPFPVSVINPDFTIDRANRAFSEMFDIPIDRIAGKKCFEIVHREAKPDDQCKLQNALATGEEMLLEMSNGRSLHISFLPFATHDGSLKNLEIFKVKDALEESSETGGDPEFARLYDLLSQPLTVLSLIADMMSIDPQEGCSAEYIEITRQELNRIITILKDECKARRVR